MPYLVDRERAIRTQDLVAVLSVRQRKVRSRIVLRDNSLCRTLTRPKTLRRCAERALLMTVRARPHHWRLGKAGSKGAQRLRPR